MKDRADLKWNTDKNINTRFLEPEWCQAANIADLHGHVAVWAAISKRAPLLLEGDEVPNGHHGVVRHIEVEQLHTGEGVKSTELTRRTGEVLGHKKAIWRGQKQNGIL